MSFQSSSHFNSTSLLIVKSEIDNTIKNVENGVSAFIEDGVMPFGIDDTMVSLEQCSNVLNLIGQPYLGKLTGLIHKLMQKVISDMQANTLQMHDVEVMSEGTNTALRYLDFLCVRETTAPQLLLTTLNKLETVLQQPLTREGTFVEPFIALIGPSLHLDPPATLANSQYVHRLYRLCLLRLLQKKLTTLDYQAFSICGNYLSQIALDLPSEQFWRLVHANFKTLEQMVINEPRQRVFIHLETLIAKFLQAPDFFKPSSGDLADVIALSLCQDSILSYEIREQLKIFDDVLSDNQLQVLQHQLFGPDLNTISAVVEILNDKLEDISKIIEFENYQTDQTVRNKVVDNLTEVCNVLDVLNLNDTAHTLREQAQFLTDSSNTPTAQNAVALINGLLHANNALQILERRFTPARLKLKLNNNNITLDKVEEAQLVLCNEARVSVQKIATQITQYSQTLQLNELNEVPALLREVSGALLFLESEQGHAMLQKLATAIEQNVLNTEKNLLSAQIHLLADAIISADNHFEQIQRQQPILPQSIAIGSRSIDEFCESVA